MLETRFTPASIIQSPDYYNRYHSFNVPQFEITPEPINIAEWRKITNQPLDQDLDTPHKLFYNKEDIEFFLNRLNDITPGLWRLPSEAELDTASQYHNLKVDHHYWTVLADAWIKEFELRPKDGSPYPTANHDRVSRLVKKGNGREPMSRAWITYLHRDWSMGVTMYLVKDTQTQNEIESTFNWLNIPC